MNRASRFSLLDSLREYMFYLLIYRIDVMADFYDFNSTFWLSLATMIFGFFGACLAYGLRSKCSRMKLCYGCIDVTRDIDAEVELEETLGQQPIAPLLQQPIAPLLQQPSYTSGTVTPPINTMTRTASRSLLAQSQKEFIQTEVNKSLLAHSAKELTQTETVCDNV